MKKIPFEEPEAASRITKVIEFAGHQLSTLYLNDAVRTESPRVRELSLAILDRLTSDPEVLLESDILISLVAHADSNAPWATDASARVSSEILSRQFRQLDKAGFIVSTILEATIKKRLDSYRSTKLTSTGRVARFDDGLANIQPPGSEVESPFIGDGIYLLSLFQWALAESNVRLPPKCASLDGSC